MTTSVRNKSVFRSFFKKQKLTGPNFIDWYRQLRLVLSTEDKENYLEHPILAAPVALPGQQVPSEALAAHASWVKGQKEELKALYSKQAEQELLQIVKEFHSCKHEEGQSVSSYVLKMKSYIDNLERLGQPVSQNLIVSLILVSLNKDYDSFIHNYNMHGMGKTVNELHVMFKLYEDTMSKKDANPALHAMRAGRVQKNQKNKPHKAAKGGHGKGKGKMGYAPNNAPFAPKPKTPPPHKKDNPAKDAICHQCELYSFHSKSWIYDTGCGTHICITTQALRGSKKLKPRALSLYMGDGHRAAVEVIGTYHLELLSGLVIVLNNCHYAPSITRGVISVSENQLGKTIKSLRSNRGGEYISQEFLDHLKEHGIIAHRTPPYTPHHNGVSKKKNQTLVDMVRSMMSQTTLPKSFWDYALETAARILNMVPTKKVDKTPYEIWHVQAPKLSYLKVWVCKALFRRDTLTKPNKLDPISFRCIFIGYPKEIIGYSFYSPSENKVFVAQNAEFFENDQIDLKASGSVEDLELIQEEDTNPSLDTSLDHEEDDQEIDEPQSDINPIRKSSRTRHAPDHMCLYIDVEEHELGDLDNDVWVLVELPSNARTIGSKWLFKKKTDMDGAVYVFKARLVAKGFTQTYGVDYEETFSPVADIRAIRILIAITAYYNYEIWKMDVKTAFLNRISPKKSIWSNLRNKRFNDEIKKFDFTKNHDEPCVYQKSRRSYVAILILYVDDILLMGNNIPMLQDVKSYLERSFAMKDLGDTAYILGIKIYRDRSKWLIGLCQSAYIEKILKRYYMENSKRGTIPMQEKLKLSKSQDAEYIAAFDASKEAVWIRKFISGLGIVPTIEEPISMYCDNTGAIAIAKDDGVTKGERHFRAKVHYLRETIKLCDVKIEKVNIDDNIADPFTKALAFPKHSELTRNIGMLPASSFM
nr:hypothetical protein [Tanacetum cinerariifolium]